MTKETDPKSLPEILAALPETAWTEPGDYPNAANILEWMRLYFGRKGVSTDTLFTLWHSRGELPAIDTPEAALRFGLAKGFLLTDAGRAKAYELGILSDDSPAVPIITQPNINRSIFQGPYKGPFSGTASATQIEGIIKVGQFWHDELKAMRERCAFLTGIQKSLVVSYLHGATGKEPYVGDVGTNKMVLLCPRIHDVICAVEVGRLARDFDALALLEWANDTGKTLTAEGLAAWERLNTKKQGNTETGNTAESGLAAAIGAKGWADIRLVVREGGVTFHGPGGWRALSWKKIGLGETRAPAQTALLMLLAKAGGYLPHSERAEAKPGGEGDPANWTQNEWEDAMKREAIRKYSELAADESQQTKVRANVKRLCKKFGALLPEFTGRPFENKDGATLINLKGIGYK